MPSLLQAWLTGGNISESSDIHGELGRLHLSDVTDWSNSVNVDYVRRRLGHDTRAGWLRESSLAALKLSRRQRSVTNSIIYVCICTTHSRHTIFLLFLHNLT